LPPESTRTAIAMEKIVFTSEALPLGLNDRARFSLWRDLFTERYSRIDVARPEERPFSMRFEFAPFQPIAIGQFAGTVSRWTRGVREISSDANENFCFLINRGRSHLSATHRGFEVALPPGRATLLSNCDPGELRGEAKNAWFGLNIPRARLLELVANAEDLAGAPLDPALSTLRHLRRYLDTLFGPDAMGDDPVLRAHIGEAVLDLIALALGAGRDQAEIARMRGLRAARLREILAEITAGFADGAFAVRGVALKLGLSPRYVQDLLHEAGASFTERVTELRLQKACAMLSDVRHDRMKVIEIALACGFDNVSYFNRCFRGRFGASPTQYRGGRGEA
jgi:AraC-like DNA-binding protein